MTFQYRKKPIVIEAYCWLFDKSENPRPTWLDDALHKWPDIGGINFEPDHPDGPRITIATLEGVTVARPGDYIIRGIEDELYPCKPNIFKAIYDKLEEGEH